MAHRFYLRLTLGLSLVILLLTGMMIITFPLEPPYLDELRAFLLSPDCENWETPCWLGIHLNETTLEEAYTRLAASPYVGPIQVEQGEGSASIEWHWAQDAPFFLEDEPNFHPTLNSRITLNDYVIGIYLWGLNIPLADFWRLVGDPQFVDVFHPQLSWTGLLMMTQTPNSRRLSMTFELFPTHLPGLSAYGISDCPADAYHFWNSAIYTIVVDNAQPYGQAYHPDFYEYGCTPTISST